MVAGKGVLTTIPSGVPARVLWMRRPTQASPPARVTLFPALDPGTPDLAPPATVADLLDQETRLLACAVGEHLPLELALQVTELRARRAALGG
jgi:hypothetical protein